MGQRREFGIGDKPPHKLLIVMVVIRLPLLPAIHRHPMQKSVTRGADEDATGEGGDLGAYGRIVAEKPIGEQVPLRPGLLTHIERREACGVLLVQFLIGGDGLVIDGRP